jgi:endonuclease/exonuclease/phosphatase family metal-dependent hydrolase
MSRASQIETGSFAPLRWNLFPPNPLRIVDWNIDRGLQLPAVIKFLASAQADLILLQEVDLNAHRTHHLDVAREIARQLRMNYVFGREFQELTQGSKGSPAYQGQATLSQWSLSKPRLIHFREQSNFWRPRWYLPLWAPFQERLGGRVALVSELHVAGRTLVTYNLHLESRGNDHLRRSQLNEVLADARRYNSDVPIIIAGDLNLDASATEIADALSAAQFQNALAFQHARTTVPRSIFDSGRSIDWVFTRGSVRPVRSNVHRTVRASDHYPISCSVSL